MTTTKEELLRVALPILQGLLASGHYTVPETDTGVPRVLKVDTGKDWVKDGLYVRKHASIAIDEALELAGELLEQIELDLTP